MKENVVTNWILVNYTATSLYRAIAGGNYRETNAGREEWISLINDAKLQPHCNKEGFNVKLSNNLNLRIGIAGNNEDDCKTCDSIIGFGLRIKGVWKWSSGNIKFYPEEKKKNTFGYIFVQ